MTNLTIQLTKAQTELMQNGEEVTIKPFEEEKLPVYLKYKRDTLVVKYTPKTLTVEVIVAGGGWCVGEIANLDPESYKEAWSTLPYSTKQKLYHGQAIWYQYNRNSIPDLHIWDAIEDVPYKCFPHAYYYPVELELDEVPNNTIKAMQAELYANLKD